MPTPGPQSVCIPSQKSLQRLGYEVVKYNPTKLPNVFFEYVRLLLSIQRTSDYVQEYLILACLSFNVQ